MNIWSPNVWYDNQPEPLRFIWMVMVFTLFIAIGDFLLAIDYFSSLMFGLVGFYRISYHLFYKPPPPFKEGDIAVVDSKKKDFSFEKFIGTVSLMQETTICVENEDGRGVSVSRIGGHGISYVNRNGIKKYGEVVNVSIRRPTREEYKIYNI